MPSLIISALISSFTFVRLIKGPWLKNPQFLAAGMIGAAIFMIVGDKLDPGSGADMLSSNILAFAGCAAGIFLLDKATG